MRAGEPRKVPRSGPGADRWPPTLPDGAVLREREAVLACVQKCLAEAQEGRGGTVLVLGGSGLGKTSVLAWAADRARAAGMRVAETSGRSMEQAFALGLATGLLAALGATRTSLEPEEGEVARGSVRLLAESVLARFHLLVPPPLVVCLDDLHWSDADSLEVVAYLARRIAPLPVAVIGALRPWPAGARDTLADLVASGFARAETVEPLGRASVRALIAERWGVEISEAGTRRAWDLSRGNPLLASELGRALAAGETLPDVPALAARVGEHVLLARFAGLDEPSMRCARAAAVLGSPFRPGLAADVARLSEDDGSRALEALFRAGLVVAAAGGLLAFAHPLFAQALYEDIPPPLRQRLHSRAFRVLAARGLEQQAAEHAIAADLAGSVEAVELLARVARRALAGGAVAGATRLFEASLRLAGDGVSVSLLLEAARAFTAGGRRAEAAAVCWRALDQPAIAWEERVEALRMLGRSDYLEGSSPEGARELDEAVRIAQAHEAAAAVRPLLDRAVGEWLASGPGRALPLAVRALELAQSGSPDLRELAASVRGYLAVECGDATGLAGVEGVGKGIEAGARRVLAPADLAWPWAPVYNYARVAVATERLAAAERAYRLAHEELVRSGSGRARALTAIHLADVLARRGKVEESLEWARESLDAAPPPAPSAPFALVALAQALVWLGRLDEAEEVLGRLDSRSRRWWSEELWERHARGMLLLWRKDAGASDEFLRAEAVFRRAGIGDPCGVPWAAHAVMAHVQVGRLEDAERVGRLAAEGARWLPCRWPRYVEALGTALVAEARGDDSTAGKAFRAAMAFLDDVDLPLDRAVALLAYGGFLRRTAKLVEARPLLRQALETAQGAGALVLAGPAQSELALAGGRRRRRSEDPWRLTPAERRVAEAAASGLSNNEIAASLYLSINTVETHLKRVFAKLGIQSRHELPGRNLDQ